MRAAQMLKVEWSEAKNPFPPMEKLHDHIRTAKTVKREEPVKKGDVDAAFKTAARVIEAEYEWPFQSHASMGPGCAVADVRKDERDGLDRDRKSRITRGDGVANLLGLPPEKVHAIWVIGPGSYGRNDAGDAAIDAALLSKLTGRPVRVQGMRRDGIAWDPKGPACVHRARAALDASGKVIALRIRRQGLFARQHQQQRIRPERQPGRHGTRHAAQAGHGIRRARGELRLREQAAGLGSRSRRWSSACSPLRTVAPARPGRAGDPLRAASSSSTSSPPRPARIRSRSG